MPIGYGGKGEAAGTLMGLLADKLRGLGVGGEGSPAAAVRQALPFSGEEAYKALVTENPPVDAARQGLELAGKIQNAADPAGLAMMPAAIGKYDMYGKFHRWDPDTRKLVGQTEKQMTAEAGMARTKLEKLTAMERAMDFEKGPLRSVGFRNRQTGEVVEGGLSHPTSRWLIPPGWGAYDDGFITRDGQFLNRRDATMKTGIGYFTEKGQVPSSMDAMEAYDAGRKGAWGPELNRTLDKRLDAVKVADEWENLARAAVKQGQKPPSPDEVMKKVIQRLREEEERYHRMGGGTGEVAPAVERTAGGGIPLGPGAGAPAEQWKQLMADVSELDKGPPMTLSQTMEATNRNLQEVAKKLAAMKKGNQ